MSPIVLYLCPVCHGPANIHAHLDHDRVEQYRIDLVLEQVIKGVFGILVDLAFFGLLVDCDWKQVYVSHAIVVLILGVLFILQMLVTKRPAYMLLRYNYRLIMCGDTLWNVVNRVRYTAPAWWSFKNPQECVV